MTFKIMMTSRNACERQCAGCCVFRIGSNLIPPSAPARSASNLSKRKMLKIQFGTSEEICCPRHDLSLTVLFVPRKKMFCVPFNIHHWPWKAFFPIRRCFCLFPLSIIAENTKAFRGNEATLSDQRRQRRERNLYTGHEIFNSKWKQSTLFCSCRVYGCSLEET